MFHMKQPDSPLIDPIAAIIDPTPFIGDCGKEVYNLDRKRTAREKAREILVLLELEGMIG